MSISRAIRTSCIALLLSAGLARAQMPPAAGFQPAPATAATGGWARFTEPGEGAYTVDVPQGWRIAGGVRRYDPAEAPTWLTAQSPDGATEIFMGDPSLTIFYLPGRFMTEGAQVPGLHNRPAGVSRYRPGAEYAAIYGNRSLAEICANVQFQGSHPMAQLEDEMRQHVQTATRLDAGEATFTCERHGQPTAAAVVAGTVLIMFPGGNGAGFWAVGALRGYVTTPANAPQAEQMLAHMAASFTPDPQFIAAIKQASEAEEAAALAQMQARQQQQPMAPAIISPPSYSRPSYVGGGRTSSCDDLQQRRICSINDGHLVVSNGCLTCIQ